MRYIVKNSTNEYLQVTKQEHYLTRDVNNATIYHNRRSAEFDVNQSAFDNLNIFEIKED